MYKLPDPRDLTCPRDGARRILFQPDDEQPLRILLVCPKCGTWSILALR